MSLDLIQTSAVKKLGKLRAGALFMEMGTGKTKIALDLCASKRNFFDIVVWIAPASLIRDQSYQDEISNRNSGLDIRFFTIEGISQSDAIYLDLRSLAECFRCFAVVDESLTIKNAIAKRTARLLSLSGLFEFRLILNGTPVSKSLADLYSQINFISPKILSMTESQFAHNFLEHYKEGYRPWQRWSKPANEAALIEIIRPYIFDAALDIPVKTTETTINLKLSNAERHDYEDFKREYLAKKLPGFLEVATKFQSYYTLSNSKITWLNNYMESHDGKTIVFVRYLHEIDKLLSLHDAVEYSGRCKTSIGEFKESSARLLVMSYGTGSKGLNLQFCNNIVFFSRTFDWADRQHGKHRVIRTGQLMDVNIFDLSLNTGLESLFAASLNKKTTLSNNIKKFIEINGAEKL